MCTWQIRYKTCRRGCAKEVVNWKTVLCQEVSEKEEPFGACDPEVTYDWIFVSKSLCQKCIEYAERIMKQNNLDHKRNVRRRSYDGSPMGE